MTPEQEQLEAQSREAIKAWCDDSSVQLDFREKISERWMLKEHVSFNTEHNYYRIAKPKKFYRVGKCSDVLPVLVWDEMSEKLLASDASFIEWLDERKYYD